MEVTVANTPAPPEARRSGSSFTIAEWCQHRRISISFFYKMDAMGKAPATLRFGRRRMISAEADADWVAVNESTAAAA
jgi:hypothetical protein